MCLFKSDCNRLLYNYMGTTATTAASGSPVTISPIPTSTLGTRKAFTTQFGNMV